tara:strand:+ start:21 stop:497 length:477 start_codon:yes stop_codon:yes gene_type:complete
MFKFQELLKFRESDVKKMAENAVDNHKRQIAVGKDFQNKSFTQYSKSYAKKKKQGRRTPVTLRDTGKMLRAFDVQKTFLKKNSEIRFTYGIKKNKQGTKFTLHNEGEGGMPFRSTVEPKKKKHNELGDKVEEGIVKDFANIIGKNLSRMSKTHVKVNI